MTLPRGRSTSGLNLSILVEVVGSDPGLNFIGFQEAPSAEGSSAVVLQQVR